MCRCGCRGSKAAISHHPFVRTFWDVMQERTFRNIYNFFLFFLFFSFLFFSFFGWVLAELLRLAVRSSRPAILSTNCRIRYRMTKAGLQTSAKGHLWLINQARLAPDNLSSDQTSYLRHRHDWHDFRISRIFTTCSIEPWNTYSTCDSLQSWFSVERFSFWILPPQQHFRLLHQAPCYLRRLLHGRYTLRTVTLLGPFIMVSKTS